MVGLHETQHRTGEQHQQSGQAAQVRGVGLEVPGGVHADGHPDHAHDQGHGHRERVEPEVEAEVEGTHPVEVGRLGPAVGDVGELGARPDGRGGEGERGDDESGPAESGPEGHEPYAHEGEHGQGGEHVGQSVRGAQA